MYSCFILSTKLGNTSCEKNFYWRNITLGHKCIIRQFNHVLFTNWIGKWFLTTKRLRSCKNCLCCTSFFKGSFRPKNLWYYTTRHIRFLKKFVFPILPLQDYYFLLKSFCNHNMVYIYLFFQGYYSNGFIIWLN
jgi:hypothetical protein